jgi:nicotinamidase-related amidase
VIHSKKAIWYVVLISLGALMSFSPASADDIVSQWADVTSPAVPMIQPVIVDPATTALLVLDMSGTQNPAKGPCNAVTRPRCIASIPAVQNLLAAARKYQVFVIYSVSKNGGRSDIATALAPLPSDPVVQSGPNKFVGTNLSQLLARRRIKSVIIVGTGAEGAVLDTATDAILRENLHVIVPVDGISSTSLYAEQYVVWHLLHAPGLIGNVTLTRSAMIRF